MQGTTFVEKLRKAATFRGAAIKFLLRQAIPFAMPFKDMDAYRLCTWHHGRLPREHVADVLPQLKPVNLLLRNVFDRVKDASIDVLELAILCGIEQAIGARNVLEIGTYDGNTALNLAANASEGGLVTTLDLPPEWDGTLVHATPQKLMNVTDRTRIGWQYKGTDLERRIRQMYGDSASINWTTLGAPFDLIFIDGCHTYDYALSDSRNAFQSIALGGAIVWHDYGMFEGVSRAVDELAKMVKIHSVRGTRLTVAFPTLSDIEVVGAGWSTHNMSRAEH